MKIFTKQLSIFTLTCLLAVSSCFYANAQPVQLKNVRVSLEEAMSLRERNPDHAIKILRTVYENSLAIPDTQIAIRSLILLAQLYGYKANYRESYDRLWTALLLADAAGKEQNKAAIYRALGRYYSFYSREENAIQYLQISLDIKKTLVAKGELDKGRLAMNYHGFVSTYRELNKPELSRIYLDSSFAFYSPESSIVSYDLLKFEEAVLHNADQEYEKAFSIFEEILPRFSEKNPSYQVLVYFYLGNAYRGLAKLQQSEDCYKKALAISEAYNSHIVFTPLVFQQLAALYASKGAHQKAYETQVKGEKLDNQFLDSRSASNRPLLEIQDEFRKSKELQAKMLQEQKLAQLEQEDKILLLQRTLLIGTLFFLMAFGVLYFRQVKSKHRSEKELLQKKRELEIQQQELEVKKARELVEMKNKELAASVLKVIEKEAFIDTLKEKLKQGKGDLKRHEISQIIHAEASNSDKSWKQFKTRFIAVNESFYTNLNEKFPGLTQGDLKLCALVKLNFSSKEMAKLLDMSVESVHTTRSRLRKKLKLSRGTNLVEFIANI